MYQAHLIIIYAISIGIYLFLMHAIAIGHIKGNGVRITEEQFPEVYKIVEDQTKALEMHNMPAVYLLQGHGILNAFATRFAGRNYVVLHSGILETALTEGPEALAFIIGHELGHIKRNHVRLVTKLLLLPSFLIPFLYTAYSRACEYTCDNIGFALSPQGAQKGLLILAAGANLYKKIDTEAYILDAKQSSLFSSWLAEICSTHPHLTNRLASIILQTESNSL